ncbi:MAG: LysM peptidoglycan-binding domain-containing protein [Oligoflexales bacterium]|nr:LysM peptidoglycan-binding domain-containing protein [Oligoflexales bacterium]
MITRVWHAFAVAFLLMISPMVFFGCASSEDGAQQEEAAVEGDSEQSAAEPGDQTEANADGAAKQQGGDAQAAGGGGDQSGGGSNLEAGETPSEQSATGSQQGTSAQEGATAQQGATGAQQGATAQASGTGQGDLQEIMDEMNSGGAAAAGSQGQASQGETAQTQGAQKPQADKTAAGDPAAQGDQGAQASGQTGAGTSASSEPISSGLPELGSKMSYIVQKGDNLATIAKKIYGDMSKWKEIANFTGITNPKLIYPGDVVYYQLTEQTMAFATSYESVTRSEVVVKQGDTLSTIAKRVLGSSQNWKIIWRQNDNIDNPDSLTAGTVIYYVASGATTSSIDLGKTNFVKVSIKNSANQKLLTSNTVESNQETTTGNQLETVNFNVENSAARNFVVITYDYARAI